METERTRHDLSYAFLGCAMVLFPLLVALAVLVTGVLTFFAMS